MWSEVFLSVMAEFSDKKYKAGRISLRSDEYQCKHKLKKFQWGDIFFGGFKLNYISTLYCFVLFLSFHH